MRAVVATLLLTLAFAAPASAGGWAVTTLDQLPPAFHAGQTYAIGYTIRQHGVTPINVEEVFGGGTTEIQIMSPDGRPGASFRGIQTGPTGHYVAQVRFPSEGRWNWQVTQGVFEAQSLGSVTVLPAGAGAAVSAQPAAPAVAPAPAPQPAGPNAFLIAALLLAMSGAAILFGGRLAVFLDRRAAA